MQNTNTQQYNECVLQCHFRQNIPVFTLLQFHVEVATWTQHSFPFCWNEDVGWFWEAW